MAELLLFVQRNDDGRSAGAGRTRERKNERKAVRFSDLLVNLVLTFGGGNAIWSTQ
jgi:hypothetical protein